MEPLASAQTGKESELLPWQKHAPTQVGLSEKLATPAGQLSGGQRRKLSVAIAFLADPQAGGACV